MSYQLVSVTQDDLEADQVVNGIGLREAKQPRRRSDTREDSRGVWGLPEHFEMRWIDKLSPHAMVLMCAPLIYNNC